MKIKVIRRFIDRANGNVTREAGDFYEAPEERAEFLIRLGLAEEIEGLEAVKAPNSGDAREGEEVPKEPKKTAKRGKKAAE